MLNEPRLPLGYGLMLATLVFQRHSGADGRIVWMALEGAARGVEALVVDDLALKRSRGAELQALRGRQVAQLVLTLIGIDVLSLRDINGVERTETLDGHAASTLRHLEADLVEGGREHLLDGSPADAAALHHCGNEYAFIFSWTHGLLVGVSTAALSAATLLVRIGGWVSGVGWRLLFVGLLGDALPRNALGELLLHGLGDGGADAALGIADVEHVGGGGLLHGAVVVELVLHRARYLGIDGDFVAQLHAVAATGTAQGYAHVTLDDGGHEVGRDAQALYHLVLHVLAGKGRIRLCSRVERVGSYGVVLFDGVLYNCHN